MKVWLIRDILGLSHGGPGKDAPLGVFGGGWARGLSACWWGDGLPRR